MGYQKITKIKQKKNTGDLRIIIWGFGYLEADFWRYYKIDLVMAVFNNEITWRRFINFVKSLPEESAFHAFIRNKENRNFVEYDEIENL
ncbi:MAG: hypothetical protein ABF289_18230 [Clostridiales bacterium]